MAVHDVVIRKRRTEPCRLSRIGPNRFHADAENVALRREQLRGGLIEPRPMRSIVANVEESRTGAAAPSRFQQDPRAARDAAMRGLPSLEAATSSR